MADPLIWVKGLTPESDLSDDTAPGYMCLQATPMECTTTCDACGRQFTFTDFRNDRYLYCCPKDDPDNIWSDILAQESDISDRPDQTPEQ